ncbi:class I SAM-dependent methyltransferase [bacterium]
MNDKIYNASIDRLRSPERFQILEVDRVVDLCLSDRVIQSVLDVGSGSGLFAEAFIKNKLSVTGIDINPEMVQTAGQWVPEAHFQQGSMESIPFDDQTFDLVFMAHVLHETNEPLQALQEARRIAKIRCAVLEWPYQDESQGPPLEHRLQPNQIHHNAEKAGFTSISKHVLSRMELWILQSS